MPNPPSIPEITVNSLSGHDIEPWMGELARLRISVFREFPYLYDGTAAYEEKYLRTYAASARSLFVLALADGAVVGVSTAIPLSDAEAIFQQPFLERHIDPSQVLYFGESVLAPAFRGKGLGHRFFDAREAYAAQLGLPVTSFCAVERPSDHSARPANYRPLHDFWRQRGYVYRPDMQIEYPWKDLDVLEETSKPMSFWLRQQ